MKDPHVKSLHYHVVPGPHVDYEKAVPITVETDEFTLHVNQKEATFEMKEHYATEEEAKAVADTFLRCWEVLIGLEQNPGDLKFGLQRADVVDRAPAETDSTVLNVHSSVHLHTAMDAVLHVSRGKFPSPPQDFAVSPDVETMYTRYRAFREGRESLLAMAYMCLTVLEASAGGRANAANKYSIAKPVLDMIGKLCSEMGCPDEARKTPKNGPYVPLSGQEKDWIAQVIKAIIRRAGECDYDPRATFRQLTLNDFPRLNKVK